MIEVIVCGPLVTVQDEGRPGHLAAGLARGGAADRRALDEAAALLGEAGAAIETPGVPLVLRFGAATTIALTGAPMRAEIEGRPVPWHAAQIVPGGATLSLKPAGQGVYSYVTPLGGIATDPVVGARAAHLIAGIGAPLAPGDRLPGDGRTALARRLSVPEDRFGGGSLRCLPTPQTSLYPPETVARLEETAFVRDARGNRQGVRLASDGAPFAAAGQLNLLSDFVLPGDVQTTGDGVPYILGPECQTTGGYPRIAHVIGPDLPRALQAPPGAGLRLRMVTLEEARAIAPAVPRTEPLVRDPRDIPDLGRYQLIDGVTDGRS